MNRQDDKIENIVVGIILSDLEILCFSTGNPFKRMNLRKVIKEIKKYQIDKSLGIEKRLLPAYFMDKLDKLFWDLIIIEKGIFYFKSYNKLTCQIIQKYDVLVDLFSKIKS
ncbi:hypothetical protein IHQ33_12490 [Enterococcus faecalis]|nr:hypothetical protein [Enterococcus faecalis]EHM3170331.1 hypothetical protein [Enterococcus faecalis]EHQ8988017.1 hypothetical protein [Enterococcus faecalis]EHV2929481.1 hypothetical protein [Enterococcus faecalis]EJR1570181.1 hypothetical protein [Enterococcus faecalis]EKK1077510.1 hypothetical protein [Enterococcus faecalis]